MLNSLNLNQNNDKTTHVKYTFTYDRTNHIIYGEFNASTDETAAAFKNATAADSWAGWKALILTRLMNESKTALGVK